MHETANVLDCLPQSMQPAARRAIFEITNAESKDEAKAAVRAFADQFGAKWSKAVAKITDDEDALLTFYDFPAEHWIHLGTTNPIESKFAPVRARTNLTEARIARRRARDGVQADRGRGRGGGEGSTGTSSFAVVRAGAKFVEGKLVESVQDEEDAA